MSDASAKKREYETAVDDASEIVTGFDELRKGFIRWLQRLLQNNPSLVLLIVLVLTPVGLGRWIRKASL